MSSPKSKNFYPQYSCIYNAPLICDRPLQTAQEVKGAKFCLECGFPATLPNSAEIKGSRGTYQVNGFLGVRGNGRIYSGIEQKDKQPVIIKEYLLPNRCFNNDEASRCKETFKRVAGVNLADGRNQNFRLVSTWEAIAEEKGEHCYLIFKDVETSQSLSKYLVENGAMTATQVREVLNQALQTLEFLHTQKLRLPSNQVQLGLAHGNINLDSALIKVEKNQQFYIYLSDLGLWENLFIPPAFRQSAQPQKSQDLNSLGDLAFYLWVGKTTNTSGQPLEPKDDGQWPTSDNYLKQYLYRLLGLDAPFESASAAREALLKLPKPSEINNLKPSVTTEEQKKRQRRRIPLIWFILLGLLLLVGGLWFFLMMMNKSESDYTESNQLTANFADVGDVPPGSHTYIGEANGTWTDVLHRLPENSITLNDLLTNPVPNVKFIYEPFGDGQKTNELIEKVTTDPKFDFAITSLDDQIPNDLHKTCIAYDGLLVFVASSTKDGSISTALQGKISLENLRKIFTGKITDWGQLNVPGHIPIQTYAPTDPEAIQLFEKVFLKNPQDIADFKNKVKQEDTTVTEQTIRRQVQDNKNPNPGIISFGILSKTWNQLSVYPLALVDSGKAPIQPLFLQRNHQPITPSDRSTISDKALYFDINTFNAYPLGFPLFVVYPNDSNRFQVGSSFARMLTTRQGQRLVQKVGLVPLQSTPDNINNVCKSLP